MWVAIIIGLCVYILVSLLLYMIQEWFIFHPERLAKDFQYSYDFEFEELNFDIKDGVVINGIYFKLEESKGLIFYLKGNSRSVKGWAKFANVFLDLGYEVLMVDYRGFGKSTGMRSERAINNDLQIIYNKITRKMPESNIIIYGRSMGTGFAARLASQNSPRQLILNASYYSFFNVVSRFLFFIPLGTILRYKIRTYVWLRYVNCPIILIHGTKDRLIPKKASVRLAKVKPDRTQLFLIDGAGHHDMTNFPRYREILEEVL